MVALSVISQPASAILELNVIAKIHKYRKFHEGHHFISMAMIVHNTLEHDMDPFIRECAFFSHDRRLGGHLSLYFCIQFFKQHISIVVQHALNSGIERKIVLTFDAYSRPAITIRCHNLHASDIRGAMGEITSYHERD
jgi:hypothetical protein